MVFSSHIFVFYFLPLVLLLYYGSPRSWGAPLLTLASYVFYGWWNPWFVILMFVSTLIDYACGKLIAAPGAPPRQRLAAMWASIVANLGVLAFFKYAAFFADAASSFTTLFGHAPEVPDFFRQIVLPVGISFYTFQSMSYSIDLYRGQARPAPNFLEFACYVSLFPQLVAGPIVRYRTIAEQLHHRPHSLNTFVLGLTRFNFGFAKKIFLANPMGEIADLAFSTGDGSLSTPGAWFGVAAYAFQIYFDFSAYSDMAIGLGRMFGFRFLENFDAPYRATSITDFWRRWHISLSTFLRDYLYIPLGGNRKGRLRTYANLLVTMLLGGLWHGASWNFVLWGAIHGTMLAFERMLGKDSPYARLPDPFRIAITFFVLLVTWVFFRAENFEVASRYLAAMFALHDPAPTAALTTARLFSLHHVTMFIIAAFSVWAMPKVPQMLQLLTLPKAILGLLLLAASLAMMFAQGFNPFLYFQF